MSTISRRSHINTCIAFCITLIIGFVITTSEECARPHRILLDTDMATDDIFALLYILKLNRSEFDLQAITINANSWTDVGHAVNLVYDILYMMDRDDIAVGIGGEGGIKEDSTITRDVGGYLPIIEQRIGTAGYCRYRQAVPVGLGGRLDADTNFGFRRSFLPQGKRKYSPFKQPTVQQVMIDKISAGPTTVFIIGALTNFAVFLMKHPHLKKNVEHIFIMGGGSYGNLYTDLDSNPYGEFNIFLDPFAAYQVIHSGIPVTLIPADATSTIPINQEFFEVFEKNQHTYEAQYCFKGLKMARDTWFDDNFYTSYFMWDPFMAGVATSIMRIPNNHQGENEFAEMKFVNMTIVTSNKPYGISDGSNSFFDGLEVPRFNLTVKGVHSGHVQTGLRDPFCHVDAGNGKCKDGYTTEVSENDTVQVIVAVKAKPSHDSSALLNREFYRSFLDVLNNPHQSGKFNLTTQFPNYKEIMYIPYLKGRTLGKNVVFDMDMSAGDFVALFYLLKVPVEVINLKGILVSATGWANAATVDIIYDLLHMMGRDDIPVGLGDVFGINQTDTIISEVGDCKYSKAIPHGSGGFMGSDTLYGLARNLPRSPRRYTAENSVEFGAPRDTDHPELRQPLAMETWRKIVESLDPGAKISVLTNGPLTNLAKILLSGNTSSIQEVFIVGGHLTNDQSDKGNVINFTGNEFAEMNMFLDPLAAKIVLESELNITLIPLGIQRRVSNFHRILEMLHKTNNTGEVMFVQRLLSRLHCLKQSHRRYQHVDIFLGEILGAVTLANIDHSVLKPDFVLKRVKVHADGDESEDGRISIDEKQGKPVSMLAELHIDSYYDLFAERFGDEKQSAVVRSFNEQKRMWSKTLDTVV